MNPSDPRLAVVDHKQKGVVAARGKGAEALVVKELITGLQGNNAAAAACLKLEAGFTGKFEKRW